MQPDHRPRLPQREAPQPRASITNTRPFSFHLVVTSRSLLGGIFGSTIPCNSVYNFNHYLCLSIKICHMAEYFSLVRLQQNISAGASQQNISAGASAAD